MAVLFASPAAFAEDLPRSGIFFLGLHAEAGLGVHELVAAGPTGFGFYPRMAVALEISERWSIQGVARMHELFETGELAGITVAPGVLFRLRQPDNPWVLGLGAGVRIGKLLVDNELIGIELGSDPKVTKTPSWMLSPDATLVLEFWPVRWFAPKFALGYAYVPTDGSPVHAIEQAVSLTFCL